MLELDLYLDAPLRARLFHDKTCRTESCKLFMYSEAPVYTRKIYNGAFSTKKILSISVSSVSVYMLRNFVINVYKIPS